MQIENFERTRGNTWEKELEFYNDNGPIDITGWIILFTAKEKISDIDAVAKMSKTITVHSEPLSGKTNLILTASDTNITPGSYIYDIKIITSSGSELTIVNGTFTILSGVTLRDS
jgi:hypothetical protein